METFTFGTLDSYRAYQAIMAARSGAVGRPPLPPPPPPARARRRCRHGLRSPAAARSPAPCALLTSADFGGALRRRRRRQGTGKPLVPTTLNNIPECVYRKPAVGAQAAPPPAARVARLGSLSVI